tara:strand:+ start:515 stop:718 length:204 start_codon:yes stop_codon:yes gene_type:complete
MNLKDHFFITFDKSIVLVKPKSTEAISWWDVNVDPECPKHEKFFAVERNYFTAIMDGFTHAWENQLV